MLRLVTCDAVGSLYGDCVGVDHAQDPVGANAQPVMSAAAESFRGIRIIGQGGDGRANGAHAVLNDDRGVRDSRRYLVLTHQRLARLFTLLRASPGASASAR